MCARLHGDPESRLLDSIDGVTLSFHFFFKTLLTHCFFLAALGLRCCGRASCSCGGRGCSSFADRSLTGRLLLLRSPGSGAAAPGLGGGGARAQFLRGIWNLPGPGIKPMPPRWLTGSRFATREVLPLHFFKAHSSVSVAV